MKSLRWKGVSKYWDVEDGLRSPAVIDVDLEVNAGDFVALIGPSGCGKTTLLEIAAGLEEPTQGMVTVDGVPVSGPGRDRTLVFQDPHLLPWLRVRQNVALGLVFAGVPEAERRERTQRVLSAVGLSNAAEKLPHQLSGGMRQRVALARALAVDPEVLLLDEPFAALDFQTRLLMQRYLLSIWHSFGTTVVFVTHQVEEALLLADRVAMITAGPGRLVEELPVPLAHPRDPSDPDFLKLRAYLTAHLEREVMASVEEGMEPLVTVQTNHN